MALSVARVRHYLQQWELEKLFIEELGWDRHSGQLAVQVDGQTYTLRACAEKRGVQIFVCQPDAAGKFPEYATRRKIEKHVTRSAYEHLIIFVDANRTAQIWQWVARQPGQPAAYREHHYHPQQHSGDALIQKLQTITIPLNEEDAIDLTGAVHKLRDAFDRDRVTRKFYDRFKQEHAAFLGFIKGITEQGDREWYASLMLNRMMFVYFIQRKGFLDSDPDYLKNRLRTVQQRAGEGKFLTFYRYFLLCLFHEGLSRQPAQRALSPDLVALLGEVPYLNGGLFELHELEQKHQAIDIADEAFEKLFAFFDQYEWHLDTRPLSKGNEINPEVLGYIFEKYINQKQMGAYYTREDITEYIGKNTVVPYLFDAAEKQCAIAFRPDAALWRLLKDDPDRYFYHAMRQGVLDDSGEVMPLPENIARGLDDVSQRDGWNRPAAAEYALPTETWREHVARRQRCLALRDRLQAGTVHQINDLITYNLDIRQFAEDAIAACEGPELLRAFYHAISTVTVLDPTCGSGAFLFAALNILEPLYEACLDRMQAFVDDLERSGEKHSPRKFADFRHTLAEAEKHPNRTYFILKSIIVNNLYGVDIMEEAVEICKLRLFLKLVAQVDKVKDLEPLPDIDFNIRPGNTLVGFVSVDEIRRAAESDATGQGQLVFGEAEKTIQRIEEEAEIVERAFQRFHDMQTAYGMEAHDFAAAKQELRSRLKKLADELDRYLAGEYGVDPSKTKEYDQWRESHRPFHWFAEFYGIMHRGGFKTIIGNPPYVESSKVRSQYTVRGYSTEPCGNLYTLIIERCQALINQQGRTGLIVPLSLLCTDRMAEARTLLRRQVSWIPAFDIRPASLFEGVSQRLCIVLSTGNKHGNGQILTAGYRRWTAVERPILFFYTTFIVTNLTDHPSPILKMATNIEQKILAKIAGKSLSQAIDEHTPPVFLHRICRYFIKCFDFVPFFRGTDEKPGKSEDYKPFRFGQQDQPCIVSLLNSSLFYWFWRASGDGFHCGYGDVYRMPFKDSPSTIMRQALNQLCDQLMKSLQQHSAIKSISTKRGKIEYQEFYPASSKPIINEIDRIWAKHYDGSSTPNRGMVRLQ